MSPFHTTLHDVLPCGCISACACALVLVGCGLTPAPTEDSASSEEALTSETFKLYDDATSEASNGCDTHTVLTLSAKGGGDVRFPLGHDSVVIAHLYEETIGDCKIHVDPNPRDYTLLNAGDSCGSRRYGATATTDGRPRELTVTDHRTRTCKDLVPANVIVEERDESADARTLYSSEGRRRIPVS